MDLKALKECACIKLGYIDSAVGCLLDTCILHERITFFDLFGTELIFRFSPWSVRPKLSDFHQPPTTNLHFSAVWSQT